MKRFVVAMIWPGGKERDYYLVSARSKAEAVRKMEREKNLIWENGTRVGKPARLRRLLTDKEVA